MVRSARSAVVGFGFSELSRKPIGSIKHLAVAAIHAALHDSGLPLSALDGLLMVQSELAERGALSVRLRDDLGLGDLKLLNLIEAKGSSVLQMVQQATMAVESGLATTVACVFSDAPVSAAQGSGQSYLQPTAVSGIPGWEERYGMFGAVGAYALAARRYMNAFSISERHFGAYAIACRSWASANALALTRTPLDIDTYLASRFIVEPFRVLDCALPVNGAAAAIITSTERASDMSSPAAYIHGMGQGHSGLSAIRADDSHPTGGHSAARRAMDMAGVDPREISMCQLYDAFSYSAFFALEEAGLCGRGEAGEFVADGNTSPGGRLPLNTGGGQLASYYLQGMTPFSEAVIQARRRGGERQVARNDLILVNGSGGCLEFNAALIVSPHRVLS